MQTTRNSNKGVNGRGDRISAKREAKRLFKKEYSGKSGRQFRKLRKSLQRGELG